MKLNTDVKVTFNSNSKSKVREINTTTKSAASQAHKTLLYRPFRDANKIMFYIGMKKSPILISFVR